MTLLISRVALMETVVTDTHGLFIDNLLIGRNHLPFSWWCCFMIIYIFSVSEWTVTSNLLFCWHQWIICYEESRDLIDVTDAIVPSPSNCIVIRLFFLPKILGYCVFLLFCDINKKVSSVQYYCFSYLKQY